jgi:hypothetical protein
MSTERTDVTVMKAASAVTLIWARPSRLIPATLPEYS